MPSAEQQKLATRRLTHWLENEKRIVTYRELSREVGCHVNTAKNLLLSHLKKNAALAPTYLLTGPLLSTSSLAQTNLPSAPPSPSATQSLAHLSATQGGIRIVDMDEMSDADRNSEPDVLDEMGVLDDGGRPGNDSGDPDGMGEGVGVERDEEVIEPEKGVARWGVVLVQQDGLEEKKGLFEQDTLNIHIYALSPSPVKDPALYLIPTLGLREHKAYLNPAVYGTITGEGFTAAKSGPLKDGGMDWGKPVLTGKKEDKKKDQAKVEEPVTKSKSTEAPKIQEKQETKAAPPEKEKKDEATKSKVADKPTKPKAKANKRIIASDDEDEPEPSSSVAQPSAPEPTSSLARADDNAAMEAMMDMDFDVEDPSSPVKSKSRPKQGKPAEAEVTVKAEPGEPSTGGGKRKRRKVKKTETSVDENGYMVSKDVWVEESCSESEPESKTATKPAARKSTGEVKKSEPPKPAAKPPPKPAAPSGGGGGKRGGQSTLAGFFKKK